jgi:phage-related protein
MPTRRKRPRATPKRRWRDYETPAGHRPVKSFLDRLGDPDVAAIVAALREVEQAGLAAAKHLRGDIYEVVADGDRQTFRILFAPEGRHKQVLLALHGFSKKTQKTPPEQLRLAERRLADWRMRGRRL